MMLYSEYGWCDLGSSELLDALCGVGAWRADVIGECEGVTKGIGVRVGKVVWEGSGGLLGELGCGATILGGRIGGGGVLWVSVEDGGSYRGGIWCFGRDMGVYEGSVEVGGVYGVRVCRHGYVERVFGEGLTECEFRYGVYRQCVERFYLNDGYLRGVKFGRILRELGVSSYPLFMMYLMWDCSRVVCGEFGGEWEGRWKDIYGL